MQEKRKKNYCQGPKMQRSVLRKTDLCIFHLDWRGICLSIAAESENLDLCILKWKELISYCIENRAIKPYIEAGHEKQKQLKKEED